MRPNLKTLHVMPLLHGYEDKLAADAEKLLDTGVCTDIACIMTLVPEGNPPEDKAQILGERFTAFRRAFKGDIFRVGILAQATIGHGWAPDEPAKYQKIIRPDGTPVYQMCPLDTEFQDYIRDTFLHIASLKPAFIMIDDDFRLLLGRNGCYCPLHLAEMSQRLGREVTREGLLDSLRNDLAIALEYDNLLLDSLMGLAGLIRDAVDETDPTIPGSFCACYGDIRHANPLAQRLAGEGNSPVVRINNARYVNPSMRSFPTRMYDGAIQVAGLDPNTTILAETDTCPHNRYSTGAHLLHSHYAGSILEGCHGAKHWLTRINVYQPNSGVAYREILSKYHGFYETLFQSVEDSTSSGYVAAVLPSEPSFNPAPDRVAACGSDKTWGALLGALGLPCNYVKTPKTPALLTAEDVDLLSNNDIRSLLKNGLMMEGTAAEKLCQRGFGAELGVIAEPWNSAKVSGERWGEIVLDPSMRYSRLTPTDPQTKIHSVLLHCKSKVSENFAEVGPAVTLFENASGVRFVVLAASFGPQANLFSFGFYNEERKLELVELLGWLCNKPVDFYYPGDAEVYLKLRRFKDGRHLLAIFNLGHDPMSVIPLASSSAISRVEIITPEGTWEDVDYAEGDIQTSLLPAAPKVFRITTEEE